MSRKKPSQSEAILLRHYEPVEVQPQPCSDKELAVHLEAFVKSFIRKKDQARWLTILVERHAKQSLSRPEKAYPKTSDDFEMFFPLQIEDLRTIESEAAYPQALALLYGELRGVYFDLQHPAYKVTAAEAATLVRGRDGARSGAAILSFVPGKKALYFDYEMDEGSQCIWICEKA